MLATRLDEDVFVPLTASHGLQHNMEASRAYGQQFVRPSVISKLVHQCQRSGPPGDLPLASSHGAARPMGHETSDTQG